MGAIVGCVSAISGARNRNIIFYQVTASKGGGTVLKVGGPNIRGAVGAECRDAEGVEGGGVWGGGLPPPQAPTNFGTLRRKSVH